MHIARRVFVWVLGISLVCAITLFVLSLRPTPEGISYGVSFNTLYARELGLDWKEVYRAVLDDLGVRHLRLAAHWPMVEPAKDTLNFEELDIQMNEARDRGVDVILGVGRRLPRWPECHVPDWAAGFSWEEQKVEIRELIGSVVDRYKSYENLRYWQVENEPFLTVFAQEQCGDLDTGFLDEEIALVKELDPEHPILITDSGNLGLWAPAYKRGDAFGTSVYIHFWSKDIGPYQSVLPPAYYRIKYNLVRVLYGKKPSLLIELSAEPWLLQPVVDTPIDTQLERMDINKFREIIAFAKETGFEEQYLWGVEWWYWLRGEGNTLFWDEARRIFSEPTR